MERIFTITENALRNLLSTYANHKVEAEECYDYYIRFMNEDDLYDLYDDAEYAHPIACCQTAEDWMRALGIHPDSDFVQDIVEKERER